MPGPHVVRSKPLPCKHLELFDLCMGADLPGAGHSCIFFTEAAKNHIQATLAPLNPATRSSDSDMDISDDEILAKGSPRPPTKGKATVTWRPKSNLEDPLTKLP